MPDNVRVVTVRDCPIGGTELVVMAGPCAVESREQIFAAAETVAASGARFLRGGAFKVRTAPTAFQGLGLEGWRLLREAADANGLLTVSEILSEEQIGEARRYVDLAQIGSRNMQNVPLLRALGRARMPVLVKRGFGCTIDEWIHAAEYVLAEGNEQVLLCERGIRTFETATRFTLDVAAVPIARKRTSLPGDRRPLARRRPARLGAAARARGRRQRRRRAPDRDPSRPEPRALGRPAGGRARRVPGPRGRGAPRGTGGRAFRRRARARVRALARTKLARQAFGVGGAGSAGAAASGGGEATGSVSGAGAAGSASGART